MIGIPLGLLTANASEWLIHKYWLHGRGKNKDSFWSFHWHDHHKSCRRGGNKDPSYENRPFKKWDPQAKEIAALAGGVAVFLPLAPIAPFFVGAVTYSTINYYRKHKRSHQDVEWGKEHMPWHYDHHMGPNQDSNWCVTKPWFDNLLGTREKWLGTEAERTARKKREALDKSRREALQAKTPADAVSANASSHAAAA